MHFPETTLPQLASMADRYFVEMTIHGDRATLAGAEAHHLAHVMRARPGTEVTLFDGSGAQFAARVEQVGRSEIELAILSREEVDRELAVSIVLGVALPKGDRQRWLVEKAVELGVARLVPLACEHSNDRQTAAVRERLHRAVVEASKQCGRNRLLKIDPSLALADFMSARPSTALGLIAHPGGPPLTHALDTVTPRSDAVHLAIGPEGGFTAAEVDVALAAGWQVVGLGKRILRVETAALAVVSAIAMRAETA